MAKKILIYGEKDKAHDPKYNITIMCDSEAEQRLALSRFEKTKPKLMIFESDGFAPDSEGNMQPVYDVARCPNCDYAYEEADDVNWEAPYCCKCGQALWWSSTEDVLEEWAKEMEEAADGEGM